VANVREIDKELADRLYDLLMIKKANAGYEVKWLKNAVARCKAAMTKEAIAWVEKQVAESD
jgi:hypothetical protein